MKRFFKLLNLLLIILLFSSNSLIIHAITNLNFNVDFDNSYDNSQGHIEYQINNGSWTSINSDSNIVISEDVTNMKIKVVAHEYYEVNFDNGPILIDSSPINFNAGGQDEARNRLIGDGYELSILPGLTDINFSAISFRATTANKNVEVNVSISTDSNSEKPIEYWQADIPSRFNFFIGGGIEFEYGQNNLKWKDDILPPNATGVSTNNPVDYVINYDNSGNVEFRYHFSNASTKIKSLIINETDYTTNCPQSDAEILNNIAAGGRSTEDIVFNIPYATEYNIQAVLTFTDLMGGFGWNYLPEETLDGDAREDCIAHGSLEFISGEYNGTTYNSVSEWCNAGKIFDWRDGDKNYTDEKDAWGEAAFPKGAKITMKLIPDEGYQLISLYGDQNIEPQDEVGVYTITMNGGMNSHLIAKFVETDDVVKVDTTAIRNGNINGVENSYGEGTMKLNIVDANLTPAQQENFNNKAQEEEAQLKEYLDISLMNTIYKASSDINNAWDRNINTLNNPATITLELNDDYSSEGELIIIHNHEDDYEIIPVQYNSSDNTITFETSKFSNYALGTKTSGNYNITVNTDGNGNYDAPSIAKAGEKGIMILLKPNDGYVFDEVNANGINEGEDGTTYSLAYSGWPEVAIFINEMPDNHISFDVKFAKAVRISYEINGGEKGDLWRDEDIVKQGTTISINSLEELINPPAGKEFDGVEIDGKHYALDEEYTFDEDKVVTFSWKSSSKEEYKINDENNEYELDFTDDAGINYQLIVADMWNLSPQELEEAEISQEEYDAIKNMLKAKAKAHGEVLELIQVVLIDDNGNVQYDKGAPYTLRIKLNDNLKKYSNLKIFDVSEIGNQDINLNNPLNMKIENGYLVIELDNLGIYLLTGQLSNKQIVPNTSVSKQ